MIKRVALPLHEVMESDKIVLLFLELISGVSIYISYTVTYEVLCIWR